MSETAYLRDGRLVIASMRERCSPQEWEARVDLAACYRLVDLYEMSDMTANHISVRVPGDGEAFLINSYGMMYDEITASSLIKVDLDGNILSRPDFGDLDYGVNKAGYVIHSAIHAARPELACVIHTHSWASMAISALKCGLLPITQTGMRFLKAGYHDYQGVVLDTAEQASLLADLGDAEALLHAEAVAAHRLVGAVGQTGTRERLFHGGSSVCEREPGPAAGQSGPVPAGGGRPGGLANRLKTRCAAAL
jgi:ribulose-5-phosphate 4-epimerase/fuculose-1-phosphate aldolase